MYDFERAAARNVKRTLSPGAQNIVLLEKLITDIFKSFFSPRVLVLLALCRAEDRIKESFEDGVERLWKWIMRTP